MIVPNKRPRRGELVFTALNADEATHYVGWVTRGSRTTTRVTVSVRQLDHRPDGNNFMTELEFTNVLQWNSSHGLGGAWLPRG